MQLINGGSIAVTTPPADPGCIRLEMASKTSHMERVLTNYEAAELCREIVRQLKAKERDALCSVREAIDQDFTQHEVISCGNTRDTLVDRISATSPD